MPSIFLSYRRQDSISDAGRLYDHLARTFGKTAVFKDLDSIDIGVDFTQRVTEAIKACSYVLVLIGKEWLTLCDLSAIPRIFSNQDYVRNEILKAKELRKTIIPVLLHGIQMPPPDVLPEELRFLSTLNAAQLRPDPDFARDLERLIQRLDSGRRSRHRVVIASILVAIGAGLALWQNQLRFPGQPPKTTHGALTTSSPSDKTFVPAKDPGTLPTPTQPSEHSDKSEPLPPSEEASSRSKLRASSEANASNPTVESTAAPAPSVVVRNYYDAVNSRSLSVAYSLLSSRFQSKRPQNAFAEIFEDTKAIVIRRLNESFRDEERATIDIVMEEMDSRGRSSAWSGSVNLVLEGNQWRIESTTLKRGEQKSP